MLYYLSQKLLDWSAGTHWADHLSALRLFRYITVRSAGRGDHGADFKLVARARKSSTGSSN